MTKLTVALSPPYDILIQPGILFRCGEYIRAVSGAERVLLITDSNVERLWLKPALESLESSGFIVAVHVFSAGEEHKIFETVSGMVNACAVAGLSRTDLVVALGGGVTGDLAGFAAGIYLRGIDFVQLPTSLLAMIDSSVGGKTGCDLAAGKNLAGCFHQPRLVLIDPDTLDTLPARYYADGLAEAVKHGVIASPELFAALTAGEYNREWLIARSVDIKCGVVERDETEQGERKLLNFGHTLGHAIERAQNFRGLSHGEAVAVGMVAVTKAAERAGLAEPGLADTIAGTLARCGLPAACDIPVKELLPYCLADKKRRGGTLDLVIAGRIGSAFIHPVPVGELEKFFMG
ncbi:MAG: 3-dehydroquinate synthase [Oscillospiraceae bacterium]|nr:3-dehydroquinate synthase [Oscillospiraceae bacterium]